MDVDSNVEKSMSSVFIKMSTRLYVVGHEAKTKRLNTHSNPELGSLNVRGNSM
jgi:hypothetical protein